MSLFMIVAWGVAVVLLVYVTVPALMAALGRTSLNSEWLDGPDGVKPRGDRYASFLFGQLRALGFRPVGRYREMVSWYPWDWTKTFETCVFVSEELGCYAGVFRVTPWEPARMACETLTHQGGLIWTTNETMEFMADEHGHIAYGERTHDLTDLLQTHLALVAEQSANWGGPIPEIDPGLFQRIHHKHTLRHARKVSTGKHLVLIIVVVGVASWLRFKTSEFLESPWPVLWVIGATGLCWSLNWLRLLSMTWPRHEHVQHLAKIRKWPVTK